MEGTSGSYRCLFCHVTVAPEGAWAQCNCGALFVDTSEPGKTKFGCLDFEMVEFRGAKGKSKGQRPAGKAGDEWTTSEVGL